MHQAGLSPIKPLPGYIVVKVDKQEELKGAKGSFSNTNTEQRGEVTGVVVAVGKDTYHPTLQNKPIKAPVTYGQKIVFKQYGGITYDQEYRLINFLDVVGIIE